MAATAPPSAENEIAAPGQEAATPQNTEQTDRSTPDEQDVFPSADRTPFEPETPLRFEPTDADLEHLSKTLEYELYGLDWDKVVDKDSLYIEPLSVDVLSIARAWGRQLGLDDWHEEKRELTLAAWVENALEHMIWDATARETLEWYMTRRRPGVTDADLAGVWARVRGLPESAAAALLPVVEREAKRLGKPFVPIRDPSIHDREPVALDAVALDHPHARRAVDYVQDIRDKANVPTISTPWDNLNRVLHGGLEIGTTSLCVGYQGSGKSSQAAQLGEHRAHTGPVLYYLGEMGGRIFIARIVGQKLGKPWVDVLRGKVSDDDMRRVLEPLDLRIIEACDDPMRAIVRELDALPADGPTPLLIVDYAQLLADRSAENARTAHSDVAADLLKLTERRQIVTWALSQTSRNNSKRIRDSVDDAVDLADTAAESSEWERSVTNLFVISYQQKDDTRTHDVIYAVSKRRFGGPTKIYFTYDGETGVWAPRAEPVQSKADALLDSEIWDRLVTHENRQCYPNDGGTCGQWFSATQLVNKANPHYIGTAKTKYLEALDRLGNRKVIEKHGAGWRLTELGKQRANRGGCPADVMR